MARSYTHDELLKLRQSPLVCKPAALPPVEEWMGPALEQNQAQNQNQRRTANRSKNEEAPVSESTMSRRPPFEGKARSANVTEDIILGPPKTAFASASGSRHATKAFESPQRSNFHDHDDTGAKNDRSTVRDRYSRDGLRDGEQSRENRQAATQNRRSAKEDSDIWSNVRQQRNPVQEDGERQYRRNGDRAHDRDRDTARENRPLRGFENHRREGDRDTDAESGVYRTEHGKSRNEPSRYRDEARTGEGVIEEQEATKSRDWRDKEGRATRGLDREWSRGGKAELEPEWMDTPEPEQNNQIHTQEDFERWKERMKTGKRMKAETPADKQPNHDRTTSSAGTGSIKGKVDTPLVVDSGIDGFFGLWNEPKNKDGSSKLENGAGPAAAKAVAKMSKASKFTGFFNPNPEPGVTLGKPSLPFLAPSADASNEDKEGFQRILNLLGQQQEPQQNGKSETPPRRQQQQPQQREPPASPPTQPLKESEMGDLYSVLGAKSPPAKAVPQATDSEFLLKLMQQPRHGGLDLKQADFNNRRAGDTTLGSIPFSDLMISPHDITQQISSPGPPPGFFDAIQSRDKLNPGAERRGPPPGFFEGNLPRQSSAAPQQSMLPSGLQRPPGLEQVPPAYQHLHSQRQHMVPPPGFQGPSRGQNAFPPGLIPNDRTQFGMPVNGRGIPPPGFVHNAPQGFPLAFGQEGMPFGPFDAGNFAQGFPPQQRRQ